MCMFVNIVMEEEASRYLACLFVCIVYSRGYLVIGRGRRALGRPQGYALSSAASFAFLQIRRRVTHMYHNATRLRSQRFKGGGVGGSFMITV